MKFIGIIPARYASTRFPGKPLAMLGEMTVIERVYRQAQIVLDDVAVATDDQRIYNAVTAFGGCAVMTSDKHRSGTDRIWEAYCKLDSKADVVINIQGDEPFIQPSQIEALKDCFADSRTQIATLVRLFPKDQGMDPILNPNTPKVVIDDDAYALYFSRSVIPYVRNYPLQQWYQHAIYYAHVGVYAYLSTVLGEITKLPQSTLEIAESLEQLRWLQNGYKIKTSLTETATIGIDTPDDLEAARKYLKDHA